MSYCDRNCGIRNRKNFGGLYWIRGTEAHVGQAGEDEERLAEYFKAVPNDLGRHARSEMWMRVKRKHLVHFSHHIGSSGSLHYESTAIMKELSDAYVEAARWGNEPPDVLCRSHRHRNIEIRIETKKGLATAFTTAGWQLKAPWLYRIAGARQNLPQIGGSLIIAGDEDIYTKHWIRAIGRSPEIRV